MKGWYYMVNMKFVGLTVLITVAAGQLGSISCFLEAATAVGVNLLTNLSRQRFCSHSFCLIPAHFPPHYLDKLLVFHLVTLSIPAQNLNWFFIFSWNFLLSVHMYAFVCTCASASNVPLYLLHY